MKQEIIDKINRLANQDEPFLFVINYQGDKAFIRQLSDINPEECLFDFEGRGNSSDEMKNNSEKIAEISEKIAEEEISKEEISEISWQIAHPFMRITNEVSAS